jgi:hypothetical protein
VPALGLSPRPPTSACSAATNSIAVRVVAIAVAYPATPVETSPGL